MVLEGSAHKRHTPVQASPSELGLLTLSRAVVQALVSPVGGFLGESESPFHMSNSHIMVRASTLVDASSIAASVSVGLMCRPLLQQDLGHHMRLPDVGSYDGGILPVQLRHAGLHILG